MYFNTGKRTVRRVQNSGKNILLDDNSKWEVSFLYKFQTMMWSIGDKVTVKRYIGSKFKFERECRNGKVEIIEATFLS